MLMKSFAALIIFAAIAFSSACSSADKQAETGKLPVGNAASPTEAYTMLFSAVKSKDPEKIKAMLSEATLKFAEGQSKMSSQSVNEVIRNGFSAATLGEKLPQIRDEQVKDSFGMIEVFNQKEKKWEMMPFIQENGSWKVAVGEAFNNTWTPPGQAQTDRERTNSNTNVPQMLPGANIDWNKVKPIKIDPRSGNFMKGPNPTLGNVKSEKIPTH